MKNKRTGIGNNACSFVLNGHRSLMVNDDFLGHGFVIAPDIDKINPIFKIGYIQVSAFDMDLFIPSLQFPYHIKHSNLFLGD